MAATLAASWASAQCPISVLPSRGCPPRELPSRGCLWELCAGPVLSRFSGVQLCVTPMDDSPPGGSSVHGILHASILEWIAIPSSRGSSRPRDRTCISGLLHQQVGSLLLAPPATCGSPHIQLDCSIFLILLPVTTILNAQFCGRFKNKTCKRVI